MSSPVETSQWRFLHSLRSVEMTKGVTYQFTSVMSSIVKTSLFCHSERSEESVNSVTIAVCYLLLHLFMSWPGRFIIFSARTQHESILIEWFHVVTGHFLTHFLPDTTPQTAYGDPSLRSGWQMGRSGCQRDGSGWQREWHISLHLSCRT